MFFSEIFWKKGTKTEKLNPFEESLPEIPSKKKIRFSANTPE